MGAVGLLSRNNKKAPTRNRDNVGLDVVNPIESGAATEVRGMRIPRRAPRVAPDGPHVAGGR